MAWKFVETNNSSAVFCDDYFNVIVTFECTGLLWTKLHFHPDGKFFKKLTALFVPSQWIGEYDFKICEKFNQLNLIVTYHKMARRH